MDALNIIFSCKLYIGIPIIWSMLVVSNNISFYEDFAEKPFNRTWLTPIIPVITASLSIIIAVSIAYTLHVLLTLLIEEYLKISYYVLLFYIIIITYFIQGLISYVNGFTIGIFGLTSKIFMFNDKYAQQLKIHKKWNESYIKIKNINKFLNLK